MSGIDAMGLGFLIGLVLTVVAWWRIDILPQIRELRARERACPVSHVPDETPKEQRQ